MEGKIGILPDLGFGSQRLTATTWSMLRALPGARGGTVMKGRRRNSEHASQYFGISLQEEQEFVMIVVPREKKCEIMSAITTSAD